MCQVDLANRISSSKQRKSPRLAQCARGPRCRWIRPTGSLVSVLTWRRLPVQSGIINNLSNEMSKREEARWSIQPDVRSPSATRARSLIRFAVKLFKLVAGRFDARLRWSSNSLYKMHPFSPGNWRNTLEAVVSRIVTRSFVGQAREFQHRRNRKQTMVSNARRNPRMGKRGWYTVV